VPPLRALADAGFDIALVVSRADARRGRGRDLTPSPVKAAALELGLEVTDRVDDVVTTDADLGVVVAFGRIIKLHVLDAVPMVNLHFSALPRWRGAAPVERAILAGDDRTAVCLMDVEEGLDTGGIRAETFVDIGSEETADGLRARLVSAGTELLVAALRDGIGPATPQQGEPVYADKIRADELALDWSRPADELQRVVRIGGAHTTFRGKRLKIWNASVVAGESDDSDASDEPGAVDGVQVSTGRGRLALVEVQPEGKPRRGAEEWRRGLHPPLGPAERMGS
jgi:methionyl-tRNA formyltransferase